MNKPLELGVQSWCFRHFKDNADVALKVRELGLDKIEISGAHADFHKVAEWKEIVKTYRDAGVSIVSLGVETLAGDARERDFFECAAAAGAKHISAHFRIDSFSAAIPKAQKLSDEYGVRVGCHCHGGYSFGGQADVLDHFVKLGAPQIGVCIDTAWCMQIGPGPGNPVEWVKRYKGRVYGVHFKDFVFGRDGQWTDTIVGEGNLKLAAFIQALKADKFDGMAVIEYEGDVENPMPALKRCVEAMRSQA